MHEMSSSLSLSPLPAPHLPSAVWRMLSANTVRQSLPGGLDALWDISIGAAKRLSMQRRRFMRRAGTIVAMEDQFSSLTDEGLRQIVAVVSRAFRTRRAGSGHVDKAFALLREVAYRQIGLRPHHVQVAAALAMEAGCVAELATGEGKTLVATMPAALAGWRGRGCHLITVNDYLARRDTEWMEPIYRFCGLTVAAIDDQMAPHERRCAYAADVTYCTNKTVAADFLRDRLVLGQFKDLSGALVRKITSGEDGPGSLLGRGLECALIDEADSVLIDEAVTPLIIAEQSTNEQQVAAYMNAAAMAAQLRRGVDYEVETRYREVHLTNAGQRHIRELTWDLQGLWASPRHSRELLVQAVTARELFIRDQHYFVQDGKVLIIDESTGRAMPDRSWRSGMHQAVEAKEKLAITVDRDTLARVSFQRFFRLYRRLAGMTGTGYEARHELWQIYHLPVVKIPTHRPRRCRQEPDRIFATADAKWHAVLDQAKKLHGQGRPVLVGTRSVEASEHLSVLLEQANLKHQVLNAVRHGREAAIVAEAGQAGRITVATNMAGRGTDIKLAKGVEERGGLAVICSERHLSARVDRQLFGRAGRQGDAGTASVLLSLEDDLVKRFVPLLLRPLVARLCEGESELSGFLVRFLIAHAQRRARRLVTSQRKSVLRADDWLDEALGFCGREL